jgi:hypothetical protein
MLSCGIAAGPTDPAAVADFALAPLELVDDFAAASDRLQAARSAIAPKMRRRVMIGVAEGYGAASEPLRLTESYARRATLTNPCVATA